MELTFDTSKIRAAFIRVNTFTKDPKQDKVRIEIKNGYIIMSSSSKTAHIRTKVPYAYSDFTVGSVLVLCNLSDIINAMLYYKDTVMNIILEDEDSDIVIFSSFTRKITVNIDHDLQYGILPNEKLLPESSVFNARIVQHRCNKIKHAIDHTKEELDAFFFTKNHIFTTDSYMFAINSSDEFTTSFDFSLTPNELQIMNKTFEYNVTIARSANWYYLVDNYANEIMFARVKRRSIDITSFLEREAKDHIEVSVKELKEALNFLLTYNNSLMSKIVAWHGDELRMVHSARSISSRIRTDGSFDYTICLNANLLLRCLKQFGNSIIDVYTSSPESVIIFQNGINKCLLMPVRSTYDPFKHD